MGTWGTSLFSNDSTCDVRDTYLDLLRKQLSNQEAYEETLEECKEYIGDSEEPLFWYALADTQWRVGRLMPKVKEEALKWIDKEGGKELWEESNKSINGWKKTLEKLKTKLETEQPKEKLFRKRNIPFQNPWGINDIYAYRIHNKSVAEEERAVQGKYVLMQKIGEAISENSLDAVMRIQIYDRLFDSVPSVADAFDTVMNYRLLPFSNPRNQLNRFKSRLQGKRDPFYFNEMLCLYYPVIMSATMEQTPGLPGYPKDEVTFICTAEGPINRQHERSDVNTTSSHRWHSLHNNIGWLFSLWHDVEYDVVGDGTFEYPTREQQSIIKSELSNN